jgi:hypothetical protein
MAIDPRDKTFLQTIRQLETIADSLKRALEDTSDKETMTPLHTLEETVTKRQKQLMGIQEHAVLCSNITEDLIKLEKMIDAVKPNDYEERYRKALLAARYISVIRETYNQHFIKLIKECKKLL